MSSHLFGEIRGKGDFDAGLDNVGSGDNNALSVEVAQQGAF